MTIAMLRGSIFPLTLLSFVAIGVEYVGRIFTTDTRWALLFLLVVTLAARGQLLNALSTRFGPILVLYCAWCLLTSFWSSVPALSAAKAVATGLTAFAFVAAGRFWVLGWTKQPQIYYLAPVTILALAAAFLGTKWEPLNDTASLYYGLAGNPNYLGILAAAGLPLPLFLLYRAFLEGFALGPRILTTSIVGALIITIWWSGSRAAFLCATTIVVVAVFALRPTMRVLVVLMSICLIGSVFIADPRLEDVFYSHVVTKYAEDNDVFSSRWGPWDVSWEGAQAGGWTGLGYGVSHGRNNFSFGLTAIGYAREKANSQLAVVEEIGIIGFVLYAVLIVSITSELLLAYRKASDSSTRIQLSLIGALILGILLQSIFEAWWTSPGSMESSIFWASVGVGSGFARRFAVTRVSQSFRRRHVQPVQGSASIPRINRRDTRVAIADWRSVFWR